MQLIITARDQVLARYGNQLAAPGEAQARAAVSRALKHEGDKGRTQVKRALVKQTGIKYGAIDKAMATIRATPVTLMCVPKTSSGLIWWQNRLPSSSMMALFYLLLALSASAFKSKSRLAAEKAALRKGARKTCAMCASSKESARLVDLGTSNLPTLDPPNLGPEVGAPAAPAENTLSSTSR